MLDFIGQSKDSEDCLPFAVHLVEAGETIQIAEDNGEIACGGILMDCLASKLEDYNVLLCVTRKIRDSFVHDMYQLQKPQLVKKAGISAVDVLYKQLSASFDRLEISQRQDQVVNQVQEVPQESTRAQDNGINPPVRQLSRQIPQRASLPAARVIVDQFAGFESHIVSDIMESPRAATSKRNTRERIIQGPESNKPKSSTRRDQTSNRGR